ncbi:MAG: hypothetical protein MUE46_17895 [Xanthomonadales bacterium]|nr:hypothetical protein [Xanthomonadales bacterium]
MKTQTESKAIDLDELVRRYHKSGLKVSFSGAIQVDPSKILIRKKTADRSLASLDRMVNRKLSKAE